MLVRASFLRNVSLADSGAYWISSNAGLGISFYYFLIDKTRRTVRDFQADRVMEPSKITQDYVFFRWSLQIPLVQL